MLINSFLTFDRVLSFVAFFQTILVRETQWMGLRNCGLRWAWQAAPIFLAIAGCLATEDITDTNIKSAIQAWSSVEDEATMTYGGISKWDTSGLTSLQNAFCSGITCICSECINDGFNADIGKWDISKVTTVRQG